MAARVNGRALAPAMTNRSMAGPSVLARANRSVPRPSVLVRVNGSTLGPSVPARSMVPEMPENNRARERAIEGATSRESGRVTEGAASWESGRAMESSENNANGWEASENGSMRSTW